MQTCWLAPGCPAQLVREGAPEQAACGRAPEHACDLQEGGFDGSSMLGVGKMLQEPQMISKAFAAHHAAGARVTLFLWSPHNILLHYAGQSNLYIQPDVGAGRTPPSHALRHQN